MKILFSFCAAIAATFSAADFSLSLNKASVAGQNYVQGTITLSAASSSSTVFSTYDNSSLVTTPASVTIGAGLLSKVFGIQTTAVNSPINTTIYAKLGAVVKSRPLTLAPLIPTALSFTPNPALGGASVSGRVVINGVAGPGGRTIGLYDNSAYSDVPSNVVVPPGGTDATFNVVTRNVPSVKVVTVTATVSAGGKQATFRINPVSSDQRILFLTNRAGNAEIFVMNPDGTNPVNLTNDPGDDFDPAWSRDHTRIAYVRSPGGIYTMSPNGSNKLKWNDDGGLGYYPTIAPNFSIAWTNTQNIFNGATNLTQEQQGNGWPSFSPDGSKIAWSRVVAGKENLWIMNADGSNKTQLTFTADQRQDVMSSWSPDGQSIVFVRTVTAPWRQIMRINVDGSGLVELTAPGQYDHHPVYSPDGTKIAFASDRDGNWEIYTMNADGSNETNITNNPAQDEKPSW